ncbi:hypothetical protein AB0M94_39540 [Streptomyces xanthochromogenes]|uniref:hypothetical protein n=1 Tax=Streptomyces xanthochromogenes TaxID=67384 RepID=UPI00343018DD
MTEIPEETQARALRALAEAAQTRDAEVPRLQNAVRDAAIEAIRVGAPRIRTQKLSGVSPTLFYAWLAEAGVPVRAKRRASD